MKPPGQEVTGTVGGMWTLWFTEIDNIKDSLTKNTHSPPLMDDAYGADEADKMRRPLERSELLSWNVHVSCVGMWSIVPMNYSVLELRIIDGLSSIVHTLQGFTRPLSWLHLIYGQQKPDYQKYVMEMLIPL